MGAYSHFQVRVGFDGWSRPSRPKPVLSVNDDQKPLGRSICSGGHSGHMSATVADLVMPFHVMDTFLPQGGPFE